MTTRFCETGEDIFISYSLSCPHSTPWLIAFTWTRASKKKWTNICFKTGSDELCFGHISNSITLVFCNFFKQRLENQVSVKCSISIVPDLTWPWLEVYAYHTTDIIAYNRLMARSTSFMNCWHLVFMFLNSHVWLPFESLSSISKKFLPLSNMCYSVGEQLFLRSCLESSGFIVWDAKQRYNREKTSFTRFSSKQQHNNIKCSAK